MLSLLWQYHILFFVISLVEGRHNTGKYKNYAFQILHSEFFIMNVVILENIRSAYNVGNIIRTADALGWQVRLT